MVRVFSDKVYISLIKEERYETLLRGLWMSLQITFFAAIIGVILGTLLAICKMRNKGILFSVATGYVSAIRGTPVVVQLLIIYFIILPKVGLPDMLVAAVAFGFNSAAYVAEIIRSGIQSIDRGQMEAGRSLGLNYAQVMKSIVLPQAIKNVLPALGNEFVILLKETSVAGYIGITDLNKAAAKIISATYEGMFALFIVAYLYFVMTTTLAAGVTRFEKRLKKSD